VYQILPKKNCKDPLEIIKKKYGQDSRVIETVFVFENKFENRCSATIDMFKDKTHLISLGKIMKKIEIIIAHI
jgi:hypothetical protein